MSTVYFFRPRRGSSAAPPVPYVALVLAAAFGVPGCTPDHAGLADPVSAIVVPNNSPPVVAAGTYVGQIDGADAPTLMAIHVAEADPAGERDVTIYVCDSQVHGNIWWFRGPVRGNEFSMVSQSGEATVVVRLTPGNAMGALATDLPEDFAFRLHRAQAGEGVYTVTIGSSGQLTGTGWVGQGLLEGQYPGVGNDAIGSVQLTLILPDGRRVHYNEPSWQPSEPGTYRAVVDRVGSNLGVLGTKFLTTAVRTDRSSSSDIIGLNMTTAR